MRVVRSLLMSCAVVTLAGCASSEMKDESAMPFGGDDSVAYAEDLWGALEGAGMIGGNAVISKPYKGQHPHGAVLDTIEGPVKVDGHTGVAIVKRNYGAREREHGQRCVGSQRLPESHHGHVQA